MPRSIEEVREMIVTRIEMEDGVVAVGDVLPISSRDADDQPRVLVCQSGAGTFTFYREDVPASTRERIMALGDRAFADEAAVRDILGRSSAVRESRRIRWYTMETGAGTIAYPDVETTGDEFVVIIDGRAVSRAWTTQESEWAVEVEVETDPEYRGRGLGKQVIAAWAAWAQSAGKVAYYSHRIANEASAAIARSLGLPYLSDDIEYF